MGTLCAGWALIVLLALLARSAWKVSQKIADWKPTPRVLPPPEPEPEPTPEELMADAKERYEVKVRTLEAAGLDVIELAAAKLKAKQAYLKELDGIL